MKKLKNNITDLVNKIQDIEGDNLLEKMISFCEKYDYNPQELGDLLTESETFKRKLWIDCVKNNIIIDKFLSDKLNSVEDFDEW